MTDDTRHELRGVGHSHFQILTLAQNGEGKVQLHMGSDRCADHSWLDVSIRERAEVSHRKFGAEAALAYAEWKQATGTPLPVPEAGALYLDVGPREVLVYHLVGASSWRSQESLRHAYA